MNHDTLNIETLKIPYLETTTFGDYTIKIEQDDMNESPRDWENLGTMVCWHNRYTLGDKHGFETVNVFFHVISGLYSEEATEDLTDEQMDRCRTVAYEKNVILPLYLYDHSGITMRTGAFGCPWDSGQVGYIFISNEDIRREYSKKRISKQLQEKVAEYLEREVKTYDQYLTGEIYGFTVEKGEEEHVDSCWGFYGYDDNYMIGIIKDAIKYDIEKTPQQREMFN